jgi:hypothetical protein
MQPYAQPLRRGACLLIALACAACSDDKALSPPPPQTPPPDLAVSLPDGDGVAPPATDGGVATSGDSGAALTCAALVGDGAAGKWISIDANGKLTYATLPTGDRLLDYSYAGYGGGGVALPSLPTAQTLQPSGGDDTAAIQAALDAVAKLPLVNGRRGAVALAAGTFTLNGSLNIAASGVVLRGAGAKMTTVNVGGTPRVVFTVGGTGSYQAMGKAATITDAYVPAGATSFNVDDATGLMPGMAVLVTRPVTTAWVHFMGMDTLTRNGMPQTWLKPGTSIRQERSITAVAGKQVTIDIPLADSLDANYVSPPGAGVQPYAFAGRISNVGIEGMHVVAPGMVTPINMPTFELLTIDATVDGWVRDVAAEGFVNGMSIGGTARRITVEDTSFTHTAAIDGSSGYPADFSIGGQQILLSRCASTGDHVFSIVTQATDPGPNVVLHFTAKGNPTNLAPHQRWATGLLLDNIESPTGGIQLMNRGNAGSGQGWAIGWGVLWNSHAMSLTVQQPPGAANWAIGSSGTLGSPLPSNGVIDSPAKAVAPASLYLSELCERLGPAAIANIGY